MLVKRLINFEFFLYIYEHIKNFHSIFFWGKNNIAIVEVTKGLWYYLFLQSFYENYDERVMDNIIFHQIWTNLVNFKRNSE